MVIIFVWINFKEELFPYVWLKKNWWANFLKIQKSATFDLCNFLLKNKNNRQLAKFFMTLGVIFLFYISGFPSPAPHPNNLGRYIDSLETVLQEHVDDSLLDNGIGFVFDNGIQDNGFGYDSWMDEDFDGLPDQVRMLRLIEMQMKFDNKIRENQIQLLEKTNEINALNLEKQETLKMFFLLVLLLLTIFLFVFIFKFRSLSKTKAQLEAQKEAIEKANTRLTEANAMRDKLFAIVSHDLRSPFSSIVSFSRIIKRDIDQLDRDELRSLVADLDKSVITINDLLDNLLQWSVAQSGSLTYRPEYLQLKEAVDGSLSVYWQHAREKGISIERDVVFDFIVWADQHLTGGILRNLLSNAIKFTPSGGRIKITAERAGNEVHVCVSDTGVGMAPDEQAKLFSHTTFFTTRGTDDERGSGLGLLICKEFVQRQGGRIWLVSEKHKGSSFYFSLPLQER